MSASAEAPTRVAWSLGEAASAIGVSERAVRRLVAAGELPVVRIGRSVRVRTIDLERFLAERTARVTGSDGGASAWAGVDLPAGRRLGA